MAPSAPQSGEDPEAPRTVEAIVPSQPGDERREEEKEPRPRQAHGDERDAKRVEREQDRDVSEVDHVHGQKPTNPRT
jgi:hypothetical protein